MSNVVFFDGVDDNVNCGTGVGSLDITGPITVIARIKIPLSAVNGDRFFIVKDTATYRYGLYWDKSNGKYLFFTRLTINGVKSTTVANINPRDNRWHHVCGTFDGRYLRIYVDGQYYGIADAGSADTITTSATALLIGSWTGVFNEMIASEFQIYNRALSDDEVLYNYSHPNNPKRRGLVLNLTQDSIYGPTWLDLSGNANNGTYVGGAVPVTANRLAGR